MKQKSLEIQNSKFGKLWQTWALGFRIWKAKYGSMFDYLATFAHPIWNFATLYNHLIGSPSTLNIQGDEFVSLGVHGLYFLKKDQTWSQDEFSLPLLKWRLNPIGAFGRKRKLVSDYVEDVFFVLILYSLVLYYLTNLILILANDIETNPGPTAISMICRLCASELEEEKDCLRLTHFIDNYQSSLG